MDRNVELVDINEAVVLFVQELGQVFDLVQTQTPQTVDGHLERTHVDLVFDSFRVVCIQHLIQTLANLGQLVFNGEQTFARFSLIVFPIPLSSQKLDKVDFLDLASLELLLEIVTADLHFVRVENHVVVFRQSLFQFFC